MKLNRIEKRLFDYSNDSHNRWNSQRAVALSRHLLGPAKGGKNKAHDQHSCGQPQSKHNHTRTCIVHVRARNTVSGCQSHRFERQSLREVEQKNAKGINMTVDQRRKCPQIIGR